MNRKGFLFAAVLLLMVLANAGLGPLLSPLLYTLTPLQRQYLPAYIASSLKGNDPQATTKIQWVLKLKPKPAEAETKPQGKPGKKSKGRPVPAAETKHELGFADEQDVVAKPVGATVWAGNALPFVLSAEAERGGRAGRLDGARLECARAYRVRQIAGQAVHGILRRGTVVGLLSAAFVRCLESSHTRSIGPRLASEQTGAALMGAAPEPVRIPVAMDAPAVDPDMGNL